MGEPCNLRYLLKQEVTKKSLQQRDRKDLEEGGWVHSGLTSFERYGQLILCLEQVPHSLGSP
jgi:hypothetical protein